MRLRTGGNGAARALAGLAEPRQTVWGRKTRRLRSWNEARRRSGSQRRASSDPKRSSASVRPAGACRRSPERAIHQGVTCPNRRAAGARLPPPPTWLPRHGADDMADFTGTQRVRDVAGPNSSRSWLGNWPGESVICRRPSNRRNHRRPPHPRRAASERAGPRVSGDDAFKGPLAGATHEDLLEVLDAYKHGRPKVCPQTAGAADGCLGLSSPAWRHEASEKRPR
jgi:hypothetical protein